MSIPPLASVWEQPMDPTDLIDYVASFAGPLPVLETTETIASFVVSLMPEAILLGVDINEDVDRAPRIIASGKAIQLWMQVEPEDRELADFSGAGAAVGIVFTVTTSSTPFRRRERTFKLTVVQL